MRSETLVPEICVIVIGFPDKRIFRAHNHCVVAADLFF
jgi:hypothetical protein